MKKILLSFKVIFFAFMMLFFAGCKKSAERTNVELIGKPTSTIERYIIGKWRLEYMYGGICGACKYDRIPFNEYYEILPDRRLIHSIQGSTITDTHYDWTTYQSHVLMSYDNNTLEVIKIKDDTLVMAQPFESNPDYMTWYLTKIK